MPEVDVGIIDDGDEISSQLPTLWGCTRRPPDMLSGAVADDALDHNSEVVAKQQYEQLDVPEVFACNLGLTG